MPKRAPEERHQALISERFQAMIISREFLALRHRWLRHWKRKAPFARLETWERHHNAWRARTPDPSAEAERVDRSFWEFQEGCGRVAEQFNLAPWEVEWAVFVRDFEPAKLPLIGAEGFGVRVCAVTHLDQLEALQRLAEASSELHIALVTEPGRPYLGPPGATPRRHSAIRMRVEFPPDYPPEAAKQLAGEAAQAGREILRRMGWPVGQRLRSSPPVKAVPKGHPHLRQ